MATYVPGSKSYLPEVKAFTPDYKFLSNVLQTRTDRYNTNYEALSDLYGKVVYADLSKQETNDARNQYINEIAPKVEQISGLDLSLQQNVDAAKSVFTPFFQDDLIVKDIVYTKAFRDQMSYAQSLLQSPNDKQVEKYWETGVKALNYQMQDFIDADRGTALQMGLPKYVEDVDLYNKSIELLNESGLFDEEIYGPPEFSPDGKWIIKTKGGGIVSQQALVFLQRSLVDNPDVQRAYYTSAYVQQRDATKNMVESGAAPDMDAAKRMWANQTLAKAQEQLALDINETENQIAVEEAQLASKERFVEKYGDYALTEKGSAMAVALNDLEAQKEHLNDKADQLKATGTFIETEPGVSTDALLNRAYNMMMNVNIGSDLSAAAYTFGQSKLQVDIEVNDYKRDEIKAQYDLSLENLRHANRMTEIEEEARLKAEAESGPANPFATPGAEDDVNIANDGTFFAEGTEILEVNAQTVSNERATVEAEKLDFLVTEKTYQTNNGNQVIVSTVDENQNKTGTKVLGRDEAMQYYRDNPGAFAVDYTEFKQSIDDQEKGAEAYPDYYDQMITVTDGDGKQVVVNRASWAKGQMDGWELRNDDIDYAEQQHLAVVWQNLENITAEESADNYRAREDLHVIRNLEGYPSFVQKIEDDQGNVTYKQLSRDEYQDLVYYMTLKDDRAIREYDVLLRAGGFKWTDMGSLQRRIMDSTPGITMRITQFPNNEEWSTLTDEIEILENKIRNANITGTDLPDRAAIAGRLSQLEQQRGKLVNEINDRNLQNKVEAKVREEAGKVYDQLYESAGDAYVRYSDAYKAAEASGESVDSPYSGYNVEAALSGDEYTSGMSMYLPGVQTRFNAQSPPSEGSPAFRLVSEYHNIVTTLPDQAVFIHKGDMEQGTKAKHVMDESDAGDVIAERILNQISLDSYAWINRGTQSAQPSDKAPSFNITRYETWTDKDGKEYVKYRIDIGNDYLKSLAGDDNIIPKATANEYSTISVIADKTQAEPLMDQNLNMRNSGAAMRRLNLRGTLSGSVANGGSYTFVKSGDNKISVNKSFQYFDPETGQMQIEHMPLQYIGNNFIDLNYEIKATRELYEQIATTNKNNMQLLNSSENSETASE